jgi:hypothetical protein
MSSLSAGYRIQFSQNTLANCAAALIRFARDQVLAVEAKRIPEIEARSRQEEGRKLSEDIRKEDERVYGTG